MRIALVTNSLQPDNGWSTLTVKRGAALMAMGVEVVVLTGRHNPPSAEFKPARLHPVLPRRLNSNKAALQLLALNPLVSSLTSDCDLIDVVTEPAVMSCILTGFRRQIVVTGCGSYIPHRAKLGLFRGIYRWLFRRAHLHAISSFTSRRIADVLQVMPPPVIIPGVDNAFYEHPRPGPVKRGPTVLCVGAVKHRKGVHLLVEAMALVRQSMPDAQCIVAGSLNAKKYVRRVEAAISKYQLQDNVHLVGRLPYEEIVGLYQSADIFALPALTSKILFEGFGLVYLEANACGLPTIATWNSGGESAVIEGESGFLVDQHDPVQLASRISQVLTDPALRERLSQGARQFARKHDWRDSAAELYQFYQTILDNAQPSGT
jgi:phosphatidyl-myo-inositol dimannoside synthase